jgi:glycosyltransferase 2 family protein
VDDGAAEAPAQRSSWRRTALSTLLATALVAAFVWALAGKWDEIVVRLREQHPAVVLSGLVLCLAAVSMSFLIWRGTMAVLGSRVPLLIGARMFFVGQLGKYLPGSVWPVVAQMRMGRDAGLPRARVALAFLLTLGMSVLWGLVVGLAALPALLREEGNAAVSLLLVVPVVLVLLVPRVINTLLTRALRLLRRGPLDVPIAGTDIVRGSLWTLVYFVVQGSHVWVLAMGLGADPVASFPVAIGGFAIAFALGPLLVVLPAGAGVREAVLVLLLATVLPTTDAVAVALTSRGLLMVTDGLFAGVSAAAAARAPAPRRNSR